MRGNLEAVAEAADWWSIVRAKPAQDAVLSEEDRIFVHEAGKLLPQEPWDAETWRVWTAAVKAGTGRKGRGLFMPLRIALTGREQGPELAGLLPLLGREETLARLS
ncbi:glutamyl-tRNA ligase [Nitratireductor aquibiodomus RA22]|uniref:Glutamyl-tRNA ligase n=1 Tax=Nitratireductor aquibiodomus RA22 TaxID=1189611 RepID=I5C657_9HYPH|nr:glutamyl-tRNA ligase [Nitratireductor aquibiodomus RA22]